MAKIINGTSGNDSLTNTVSGAIINALGGKDTVNNTADKVTITGGENNDSINNGDWDNYGGSKVTIDGGAGNDLISLSSNAKNNVIQYSSEDGNDKIIGFNTTSTLKIGDGTGTYSSTKSGMIWF